MILSALVPAEKLRPAPPDVEVLVKPARRRVEELIAQNKLESILGRVDVLLTDWKLEGDSALVDAYVSELRAAMGFANKVVSQAARDADEQLRKETQEQEEAEAEEKRAQMEARKSMALENGLVPGEVNPFAEEVHLDASTAWATSSALAQT